MDAFWKGLARVNARGVCAVATAVLVCVVWWLVWEQILLRGIFRETAPPGAPEPHVPAPDKPSIVSPGLLRLAAQAAPPPFSSSVLDQIVAKAASERAAREKAAQADARAQQAAKPAEQAPRVRVTKLHYRGLLRRTDGTVAALVENMTEQRTGFYEQGETIGTLRVAAIDAQRVALAGRDGQTVYLALGCPQEFSESLDDKQPTR
ncbi:MAG: hypothetical protein JXR37_18420 [Kiritimatiellae bacterium]|nr:hypothetical protein [Kiritimatiellia bacterium]